MSSGDFNLLHLRNLKMYNPDGSHVSTGYVFTVSTQGTPSYTNSLALDGVTASTVTASAMTTSTLNASAQIGFSTLVGSTLYANSGTISTLATSTLTSGSVAFSTLVGSTLYANSGTISTLTASTVTSGSVAFSTLVGSTISATSAAISSATFSTLALPNQITISSLVTSSLVGGSADLSSITVSTLNSSASMGFSTLVGSSLSATSAAISSLTTSTLTSADGAFSTLSASTLTASTLSASTLSASTLSASTLSASTLSASTLTTSSISTSLLTTPDIQLMSTQISLGLSTTSTQINFSEGDYSASSWLTAKSDLANVRKLGTSASGQYQLVVSGATSDLWLSSDAGITWSALTPASTGLPVLTGASYWSSGSISANGQHILLGIYGGSLWMSQDFGRTFAPTAQPTPDIWLQLNGNVNDAMGGPAATATGSPAYVTVQHPGFSDQAVNLANTAGGTATRYVRGNWTGATNMTISLWFNSQALNSTYQQIFSAYNDSVGITIAGLSDNTNQLYATIPTGGGTSRTTFGFSATLSTNTWYFVTLIFQTNGVCSFYLNNALLGTLTNTSGVGTLTTSVFELGGSDLNNINAFNGYIADLRLLHSAPAYVPLPLLQPNIWLPFENNTNNAGTDADPLIRLEFEGNTTDSKGFSTITPTGSFTYVGPAQPGVTGNQAINLANTAGGTATNYVRGTWAGAANFAVSLWVNPQTVNGTEQRVFGTQNGYILFLINPSNQLVFRAPNGSSLLFNDITTTFAVSTNTWYHLLGIFQSNGTCSFYVNGTQIGTFANSGGFGTTPSSGIFGLGCQDNATVFAFNGYLDDLRIFNSAVTYSPAGFVTGSVSYVPGVVGLNAVNLVNTAGEAATNYILSPVSQSGITNVTVSCWFNIQSIPTSGASVIVGLGGLTTGTYLIIFITTSGGLIMGYLNSSVVTVTIGSVSSISLNTWYHAYLIFEQTGTCFAYLNGTSIGSVAGGALFGNYPIYDYALGRNVGNNAVAFNGYIDDLRIYNTAIPYHALLPQNYRSVALSGTGQYALASAASGWVLGSTNSQKTWAKQAVCVGSQSDLVMPNQSGLTANQWGQSGIQWNASASSVWSTLPNSIAARAFNNTVIGPDYSWVSTTTYSTSTGSYTGSVSTTIQGGIGAQTGEWLQIQTAVPLVLTSYTYGCGGYQSIMKNYYIVGSMDGSNWYPLQYVAMTTNPFTTNNNIASSYITTNTTGSISIQGNVVGAGTSTAYSFTTQPWMYFRIIIQSTWNHPLGIAEIGELYLNFSRTSATTYATAHPTALSLSYSGQYQLVATNSAAGNVMPNQSGLVTSTWVQGGVTWGATASSRYSAGYDAYRVFNNLVGDAGWLSAISFNGSGVYTGSISTTIQTVGAISGEWFQLQTSVPLVLSSYRYSCPAPTQLPKTYYIVGSMDGSTWFPIHYANTTVNPFNGTYQSLTTSVLVNSTGILSIQGAVTGSVTTTSYSYSTQPFMYFRWVITSSFNATETGYTELFLNFQNSASYSSNYGSTWLNSSRTLSNEIVALSPSGQYALSTNCVPPLARLTLDNTNVDSQGVLTPTTGAGTVTYSTAIRKVGTHSAFFNNTAGVAPSVYLNYTVPAILGSAPSLSVSCWIYMPSLPLSNVSSPFGFNTNSSQNGTTFYVSPTGIVNATFITTGHSNGLATSTSTIISINSWNHIAITYQSGSGMLYVNGQFAGSVSTSGTLMDLGSVASTNIFIGGMKTDYGAFAGYIDDVRIYTQALSADEVNSLYQNPALTQSIGVSNSFLPITSYTEPVLPNVSANVVDAKVSQTGQYMVAVTSATSNNVYYSTDFGATFNALTIGTSPMTACSISHDGSYLTVSNATTIYTLNKNSTGYTLAIGNQAGQLNQAENAIAIGNQAGILNQSANSIVLNASGSALNATAPGFYVAPIGDTAGLPMNLLGYGSDQQVVKTGVTVLPGGIIEIPGPNPTITLYGLSTNQIYVPRVDTYNPTGENNLMIRSWWGIGYKSFDNVVRIAMDTRSGSAYFAGNVGIGTTDPAGCLLRLNSTTSARETGIYVRAFQASLTLDTITGRRWNIWSTEATNAVGTGCLAMYDNTAGAYRFLINQSGHVGINTTSPPGAFSVFSSTADYTNTCVIQSPWAGVFLDNTQISGGRKWGLFLGGPDAGIGEGNFGIWDATTNDYRFMINASGNVGIGTTNPGATLHVNGPGNNPDNGPFVITNSANNQFKCVFSVDGSGNCIIAPQEVGTSYRAFLPRADNSSGLGSTSNRWIAVWAVNGTIQTSDSNVKDSEPLPYGINEILQVRTIKYKWKSQADLPDDDPTKNFEYYGFCADELGPLFPELVYDENKDTPVQMNYTELLPVVVNAMKEEHASTAVLKTTVENQAEQITSLQSELASTQATLAATQSQLTQLLSWAQAQGFSPA